MTQPNPSAQDKLYVRLKSRLTIDTMQLDQELIELPQMLSDAGEATAYCIAARDVAKNELDINMSIAADRLRQQPITDSDGKEKRRSEKQIETEIMSIQIVKDAHHRLEEAKLDLALWQSLVDGIRAKQSSIKTVSDLMISGYLAPSSITANRRAELRGGPQATNVARRRASPMA
jgi:hypothetical protein